jgi:PAS domain S-box-containing protein
MKADHKTERQIEAELADLRQQLAAANRRIAELEAVEDRRKSAAALADTQEQIELIVDTLPVLLAYIDVEQRYLYVNRFYADWYGLTREEIVGKHVRDVLHEATYQRALPPIEAALQGQRITYENDAAYDVQGQSRTVRATYVPHLDENGQAKAFLAMVEDITERKQTEKALRDSETRYRRLFEVAQDGILLLDADTGQVTDVNPFMMEMLGYSLGECQGKRLWEIGPFKDIVASQAAFEELQRAGYIRYEDLPLETKEGRLVSVEFVSNVYLVDNTRVIQCNVRDVTERKRAAAKLAEQLDELRRWHQATLGRETRILDLKREVNELLAQAGQPPRYPSAEVEDQ